MAVRVVGLMVWETPTILLTDRATVCQAKAWFLQVGHTCLGIEVMALSLADGLFCRAGTVRDGPTIMLGTLKIQGSILTFPRRTLRAFSEAMTIFIEWSLAGGLSARPA
jgi:hypothetical protein